MIRSFFKGIWQDRYIMASLVNRDLQIKYRKSILGVAWSILTPLGLVLIIGSVYSIIFGTDPKELIPALFAGINPWFFMTSTADIGCISYIQVEGYIKQIHANNQIFPLRVTISNFINLMYSIIAFFAVYLFLQPQNFGPQMLLTIPGLLIMFVFSWSLAGITSIINLNVRDYQPFQSLLFQGLFYATPIVFEPQVLADGGFAIAYELNPFYYMLEIIKRPMLGVNIPGIDVYITAIAITLVLFIINISLTMKCSDSIALKL